MLEERDEEKALDNALTDEDIKGAAATIFVAGQDTVSRSSRCPAKARRTDF